MITESFRKKLENDLEQLMNDYDKFRAGLASQGAKKINPEDEADWEHRIKALKNLFKGNIVHKPTQQREVIDIGSVVTLALAGGGGDRTIIIDGASYRNNKPEIVGHKTPIGQQLLGKKTNEIITTKKDQEFVIKEIGFPW